MKYVLPILFLCLTISNTKIAAQCSTSSTPTSTCTFGDAIDAFTLASVATSGNYYCNSNVATGYSFFSSPVRNLNIGGTYSFSATTGTSGSFTSYTQGFAIWIDLNNNGQYESSELMYTSSSAALSHSGNITIPVTATAGTNIKMRTRCRYNATLGSGDMCASYTYGETEDYNVNLVSAPCSGTPAPGNTLSSLNPVCNSSTSFVLSLQNSTSGAGVTHQWQYSPNGTTWSNLIGNVSSTATVLQSSSTYYRCLVTCSGNTGTSNPLLVTTSFLACYCAAANTSGCTFGDNITNVTLGTLNNTTGCIGAAPSYINYSGSVAAPTLLIGATTNTLSVSVGNGGPEYVGVWIDYNQNGVFDASEFTNMGTRSTAGALTSPLTIPATALTGTTRMRVRVRWNSSIASTDACTSFGYGETEDYNVNLVCPLAPLATHPSNKTACPGGNTSFTALGDNINTVMTYTYQWQLSTNGGGVWNNISNGGVYSNVTAATLNLTAVPNTMNNYQYRCIVTNACGNAITSNAAILDFYTPPVINTAPVNQTICPGASTTFSCSVTGTSLNYQWELSTNGGGTWSNVTNGGNYSNATTATLTVSGVTAGMDAYQYRCVISNPCVVTTGAGRLNVHAIPAVTINPADKTVCAGSNTTFQAAGTGAGITYQWQEFISTWNNISNGGIYSGATTANLTLTGITAGMHNYRYRCVISGTCTPFQTTGAATLSIGSAPVITAHPNPTTACIGTNTSTMSITATGYNNTYQWQESTNGGSTWGPISNGATYGGVTTTTLTFLNPTLGMNGYMYRCVATNGCAVTATSNTALLTVANSPTVTQQPIDVTICAGSNATYTIAATSSAPVAYQWQGSTNGTTWTNLINTTFYSGTTTTSLLVTNPNSNAFTIYRCVLNTGCIPPVTSNNATLTIQVQPTILSNPQNMTICQNGIAAFGVNATGTSLTYQWQESTNGGSTWNNVSNGGIYSGATGNILTLTSVQATHNSYRYRCIVTGACPTAKTSTDAVLTVNSPVVINSQPTASTTICSGGSTSFTVGATGTGLAYQWWVHNGTSWAIVTNGGIYSGATSATLNITGITAAPVARTFLYYCSLSGTCNGAGTNTSTLVVNALPVITSNPVNVTRCDSTSNVSFTAIATGTGLTYQWQLNTGSGWNNLVNNSTYSGVTTTTLMLPNVYFSMNGYQYRCEVTGTCGTTNSGTATLTVNPRLTPSVTIAASNADICAGATVTFTATPTNGGTPTYQWKKNGVNVATGASFATATIANGDIFRVEMTSNIACPSSSVAHSNQITMQVTQYVTPTIVITSSTGTSGCSGKPTIYRASITNGGPAPTYQWEVNGIAVGTNVDTYLTTLLKTGDQVRCKLTGSTKCYTPAQVTSNTITMTILPTTTASIVIAANPDSVICEKTEVTLHTFFTNGGTTPAYQWMMNGNNIPGQTGATMKIKTLTAGDVINCMFISSAVCVFPEISNPITFDVSNLLDPSVNVSVSFLGNNEYMFTAIPVNGGLNPSYQWYRNFLPIGGETGNTYTTSNLAQSDRIYVEMTSSEDCINPQLLQVQSRITTTGVGNLAETFKDLGLYPNPNTGQFTITGELNQPIANKDVVVKITNSLGQVVYNQTYTAGGSNIKLPVTLAESIANGIYTVNIVIDNQSTNMRFMLNR